jgi:ankyrin repeat protein
MSARAGNLAITKMLIEANKSLVNLANKDGLTPIFFAVMSGSVEVFSELLRNNSDFGVILPYIYIFTEKTFFPGLILF